MKEIQDLLQITAGLRKRFEKNFTLDGKLVGDIGEVLAKEKYGLELLGENNPVHDAFEIVSGKKVQVKSTMIWKPTFPCNHVPDFLLAIQIEPSGEIIELYNGPGQKIVDDYINKRRLKANNGRYLYTLSANILLTLNREVDSNHKIKIIKTE